MALFLVRVELHEGDGEDYELLHEAMEERGFSREIEDDTGKIYALPTAEYVLDEATTRDEALDRARVAADETNRAFEVVAAECLGISFDGLEEIE